MLLPRSSRTLALRIISIEGVESATVGMAADRPGSGLCSKVSRVHSVTPVSVKINRAAARGKWCNEPEQFRAKRRVMERKHDRSKLRGSNTRALRKS